MSNFKTHPVFNLQVSDTGEIIGAKGEVRKLRHDKDGYLRLNISYNGKIITLKVHALVLETFVGFSNDGQVINHKNGIKSDNRLENLEYVSIKENVRHALIHNLLTRSKKVFLFGSEYPSMREAERVTGVRRTSKEMKLAKI